MNCFKKNVQKDLSSKDLANVYGEVCIRKQRRKRQKLLVTELLLDYAKNSTLHGLRYITERGLNIIEKTFWLLTFVISSVLCSLLISNLYMKWKNNPVIVTFSDHLVPVWMVPFPSVTICPQIKCMASKYNFSEKYINHLKHNETERSSLEELDDVTLICDHGDLKNLRHRYSSDISIVKKIYEVSTVTV